ncbi:efflux RND transporter permease subunit [Sphingomonas sp. MMS24-JH45]
MKVIRDGRRAGQEASAARAHHFADDRRAIGSSPPGSRPATRWWSRVADAPAGHRGPRDAVEPQRARSGPAAGQQAQSKGEAESMSRFFIDRPIFAWVIASSAHARRRHRDPQPAGRAVPRNHASTVTVNAVYPGADAQTLERTTTQIIEQQLRGIDNLRHRPPPRRATSRSR